MPGNGRWDLIGHLKFNIHDSCWSGVVGVGRDASSGDCRVQRSAKDRKVNTPNITKTFMFSEMSILQIQTAGSLISNFVSFEGLEYLLMAVTVITRNHPPSRISRTLEKTNP